MLTNDDRNNHGKMIRENTEPMCANCAKSRKVMGNDYVCTIAMRASMWRKPDDYCKLYVRRETK